MLAAQRREHIRELIRRNGAVRVNDLVAALEVSDMTVRRDLDALEGRGELRKVHGGAVAPSGGSTEEPAYEAKATRQVAEKHAIGRAAAALVEPGSAIGITAGTTPSIAAEYLRDIPGLTVVTNSLHVAEVFHRSTRSDQTVALTGGFRTPSDALVGPIALTALRDLHLDVLLLGVYGMHERTGFTTPNLMESETNRAFVDSARTLIVPVDHTKWGTVGISTMAPLDRCDVLVSDDGLDGPAREALAEHAGELVIAPTEEDE
ncbi:DeoR/GlpR family DNA-binding transcription regulator [Nocardiopsis coralliicola]